MDRSVYHSQVGFPCVDVPQVTQQLMDFSVVWKIVSTHMHELSELGWFGSLQLSTEAGRLKCQLFVLPRFVLASPGQFGNRQLIQSVCPSPIF